MRFLNFIFSKPKKKLRAVSSPRRSTIILVDHTLQAMWNDIQQRYFPERSDIQEYKVCWSRRHQKRVLGSCHIRQKVVRVAQELATQNCAEWLEPLLYHEMCHAIIGENVERRRGKRLWHGREFKILLAKHPGSLALDRWIKSGGWREAVRVRRAAW